MLDFEDMVQAKAAMHILAVPMNCLTARTNLEVDDLLPGRGKKI